jgi:hypothetical protein
MKKNYIAFILLLKIITTNAQKLTLQVGIGYANTQSYVTSNSMPSKTFNTHNYLGLNPQLGIKYALNNKNNVYFNVGYLQGSTAITFINSKKNIIDFFWGGFNYISKVSCNSIQIESGYEKLMINKNSKTYLVAGLQLHVTNALKDSTGTQYAPEIWSHNLAVNNNKIQPGIYLGIKHAFINKRKKEICNINAGVQTALGAIYGTTFNYQSYAGPPSNTFVPQTATLEYRALGFRLGVNFNIITLIN